MTSDTTEHAELRERAEKARDGLCNLVSESEVCHCGDLVKDHTQSCGHTAVPMHTEDDQLLLECRDVMQDFLTALDETEAKLDRYAYTLACGKVRYVGDIVYYWNDEHKLEGVRGWALGLNHSPASIKKYYFSTPEAALAARDGEE